MDTAPAGLIPEKACEHCGCFDTLEMAGQFLCADCVALAGGGCAGNGDGEN